MMKTKVAILTTMGLLFNLLWPQPVSAEYDTGDLERLQWLCGDYQLPVKGYVIEGWFALQNRPGLQSQLEQQLTPSFLPIVWIVPPISPLWTRG